MELGQGPFLVCAGNSVSYRSSTHVCVKCEPTRPHGRSHSPRERHCWFGVAVAWSREVLEGISTGNGNGQIWNGDASHSSSTCFCRSCHSCILVACENGSPHRSSLPAPLSLLSDGAYFSGSQRRSDHQAIVRREKGQGLGKRKHHVGSGLVCTRRLFGAESQVKCASKPPQQHEMKYISGRWPQRIVTAQIEPRELRSCQGRHQRSRLRLSPSQSLLTS